MVDFSNYLTKVQLFFTFITTHLFILYPLLAAIVTSMLVLMVAKYKKQKKIIPHKIPVTETPLTHHDIRAIAGEDMIATQLDLARAYLETGNTQLAHGILNQVMEQGNLEQFKEAEQLLQGMYQS